MAEPILFQSFACVGVILVRVVSSTSAHGHELIAYSAAGKNKNLADLRYIARNVYALLVSCLSLVLCILTYPNPFRQEFFFIVRHISVKTIVNLLSLKLLGMAVVAWKNKQTKNLAVIYYCRLLS